MFLFPRERHVLHEKDRTGRGEAVGPAAIALGEYPVASAGGPFMHGEKHNYRHEKI